MAFEDRENGENYYVLIESRQGSYKVIAPYTNYFKLRYNNGRDSVESMFLNKNKNIY